ncbi:MAG: hypothetical protein V5B36_02050 [Candidatus Accumulibacter sp. UW25]
MLLENGFAAAHELPRVHAEFAQQVAQFVAAPVGRQIVDDFDSTPFAAINWQAARLFEQRALW